MSKPLTLSELRVEIAEILTEAKKKAEKAEKAKKNGGRAAMAYGMYDEALDFACPLGELSLYRQQGAVNFGPYTSGGTSIDSRFADPNIGPGLRESEERVLRRLVREVLEMGHMSGESAWAPAMRERRSPGNIWEEAAMHLEALGEPEPRGGRKPAIPPGTPPPPPKASTVDEKKIGFDKLSHKLSHQSGVDDPDALAASIGRKKYGNKGMAKKSSAGRK